MLQRIRERSQGIVAWGIILLVSLTFAMWGIHNYIGGGGGKSTVAKVNGSKVTQAELDVAYNRLRQREIAQQGINFVATPSIEKMLKLQALQQIISSKVLVHAAKKEGFAIDDAQIRDAIRQIPEFTEDGRFSQQRFEQVLNSLSYSDESFITALQTDMLIKQVSEAIAVSAFALPNEVKQAVSLIEQQRDIAYIIVPANRFSSKTHITHKQMQDYYQAHKAQYMSPETVSLQYIELSADSIAKQQHVSEDEIKQNYQDNINQYTTPGRWKVSHILIAVAKDADNKVQAAAEKKAQAIYQQLQSGKSFAKLAEQNSQDILSAKQGGNLGWVSMGTLGQQFDNTIKTLKVGQYSKPVKTKYGYDIIKVTQIQAPKVKPLAQVHGQIKKSIALQKAQTEYADDSDQLTNLTYEQPDSLQSAAKTLGLKIQTTPAFTRKGLQQGLAANRQVVQMAFSDDVLVNHNNSTPIELSNNSVVVIRVAKHQAAKAKPFAHVKSDIQQTLASQQAKQQATKFGEQLVKQLQNSKDASSVLAKNNVKWSQQHNVTRHDSAINPAILQKAFAMPKPGSQATIAGVVLPNGDYGIISLSSVHQGETPVMTKAKGKLFKQQIEAAYGELDYGLYVKSYMSNAKIKMYKQD